MQNISYLITYPVTLGDFKEITNSYLKEYETLLFDTFILKMVELITKMIIENGFNYTYTTEVLYFILLSKFQFIMKEFPNKIYTNVNLCYSIITNLMIDVCNKIKEKFIGITYKIEHKDKISFVWN